MARLVYVDGLAGTVAPVDPESAVIEIGENFVYDGDDFVDDARISCQSLATGVRVATLWDAWQLVNELELVHLLTEVGSEDMNTFIFRVDGDGEELEGFIVDRFFESPADINGLAVPLVASDLPAVLVDCGDRGSWLVPLSWKVQL